MHAVLIITPQISHFILHSHCTTLKHFIKLHHHMVAFYVCKFFKNELMYELLDVFCAECVITIIVLIIHYYDSPSLIMINKYNNVCVVRKKKIMAYYCRMYFYCDTRMPLPPCVLLDFIGKHESCHTYILHFIESPACYLQTNTTKIL
jgi:hypothetical protein